jgi:ribonuclease-3
VFRRLYNYYFSKERQFIREITQLTGFIPYNAHLYHTAFIHRSVNQAGESNPERYALNNERLEFLGDAVLDAVTAEFLYNKYPTQDEGFLTQMRSKIVNRKTLNRMASDMGLDVFLKKHGLNRISPTMLGNTFEAFVGAVYLDVGYNRTRQFILRLMRRFLNVHELESVNHNYKSQLLEYCQKQQKLLQYELISHHRTRDNRERFKVAVIISGSQTAVAEDFSKKSAEQLASKKALLHLGVLNAEDLIEE